VQHPKYNLLQVFKRYSQRQFITLLRLQTDVTATPNTPMPTLPAYARNPPAYLRKWGFPWDFKYDPS